MSGQPLPILYEHESSLRADGSRNYVHPADVHGRFDRARKLLFGLLIALWAALPWLQVGGHPALFLDVQDRRFYLFGHAFNAQDVWLMFFLLSGVGFALIVMTALWGRLWCGYACPQTVFLEGVFRPIERLIEGPRAARLKRNAGPLTLDKLWRKALKQLIYLLLAFAVAHIVLAYFVSLPGVYRMVLHSPAAHPTAFAWALGLTSVLYFDFAWFREQMCLIVCPYGRLQSVLTDRDTLVIGYDSTRGEPRGKVGTEGAGACVDCKRCVVVCPTGIDIRNGLQIDCVGCARCVDACDDIMDRLGRPRGLVRYDSLRGLSGQPRRLLRPRLYLYAALGLAGLIATGVALASTHEYEANLLRLQGAPPFVVDDGTVRNAFEVHLVNKESQVGHFELQPIPRGKLQYTIAMPELSLGSLQSRRVPVFVSFPRGDRSASKAAIRISVDGKDPRVLEAPLIGPE